MKYLSLKSFPYTRPEGYVKLTWKLVQPKRRYFEF